MVRALARHRFWTFCCTAVLDIESSDDREVIEWREEDDIFFDVVDDFNAIAVKLRQFAVNEDRIPFRCLTCDDFCLECSVCTPRPMIQTKRPARSCSGATCFGTF